jgi:hypothetical protein
MILNLCRGALAREPIRVESRVRRTDGQYRWLLRKAKLLSDRICVHPTLEGTVQRANACFYAGLEC